MNTKAKKTIFTQHIFVNVLTVVKQHLNGLIGVFSKMIPDYNLEKDDREILKREYCETADKIRKTMVLMSYYKYGPARKNFAEGRVDAFKSAEECMEAFKKDKNTEHLLDAMNYLVICILFLESIIRLQIQTAQ